jgi:hypothetical protein
MRATKRGSFVADLAIHSPDAWDQIMQLLSGKAVTALTNLYTIIAGTTASLFAITKLIHGRQIVSKEPLESGLIRVTLADGSMIEGMAEAVALYERLSVRENAREVVAPLHSPGVERLTFVPKAAEPLTISDADLPAFDVLEMAEETLLDREDEAILTIATASFAEGYKWRFSEGDSNFTASIEDSAFRSRIDAGEAFRKGDTLHVRMRVVTTQRGNKLHVDRTVLQVVKHIPREVQISIDTELDDAA